jgi:hypothetical protein
MKYASIITSLAQLQARRHDMLTNLNADDHVQYLNVSRHDVVTRHPLSVLDSTICSISEADNKISAHDNGVNSHWLIQMLLFTLT